MFNSITSAKLVLFFLFGALLFMACGCGVSNSVKGPGLKVSKTDSVSSSPSLMNVSESDGMLSDVEKRLHRAHREWEGTPYVLGGNSSDGIDCSAFTQTVFRDYFNKDIPRDTRSQLFEGSGIRRKFIRTGDLIFFKTGRKSLHVGIAIGDGDFLHASRSSGVMISNIREHYWATRYLGARRVL